MRVQEANHVVSLVAELWPQTRMGDARKAMFVSVIMDIPDVDAAIRAVRQAFVLDAFPPTPGRIIDLAVGISDEAALAWTRIVCAAVDAQSRRPTGDVDRLALQVLRSSCGTLHDVPINVPDRLDRVKDRFMEAFRHQRLLALTTGAAANTAIPIDAEHKELERAEG